jgi:hypothetical protein
MEDKELNRLVHGLYGIKENIPDKDFYLRLYLIGVGYLKGVYGNIDTLLEPYLSSKRKGGAMMACSKKKPIKPKK